MVVEGGIKQFVKWTLDDFRRMSIGERPVPDPGYLQTVLWNV